ncbi:ADP-ribose pyrophosphatase YjhB, NUDIX family [Micromonospora coriariae]|uniref:ADP-ribose pyrophosphatase YjhB, NUDIX family n=1 Tax=Micromonospora coriariae TaxID=285665 RepID=A0A1C4WB01_9ACTN|nr:NUDIX domain-containing protein [Micromonospora coriariae]SCE93299.1 ADP-ribose pyrophosphatase YjhB, NUDIX family [Micromonospora coriariae]
MELRRGVGVYGVLWDSGRVLVVRERGGDEVPGVWRLPGGAVAHAEHPEHAVVREVAGQTGLTVTVDRLRAAVADVTTYPEDDVAVHTDRLAFELSTRGGALRDAGDGPTDQARWVTMAEAERLPLAPFSAELLGLPVTPLPTGAHRPAEPFPPAHPDRRLRFGAYGLVTDPAGRILLTQIAAGYPGAGRWHLPGGGTDHGEQPTTGLLRELVEEGGQLGRVVELLGVDNLHNPAAFGPEGRPLDWHGVRVIYRVLVDVPTDAVVTESAGGSTARAGWFTPVEAADLPLTGIAASAIGQSGR